MLVILSHILIYYNTHLENSVESMLSLDSNYLLEKYWKSKILGTYPSISGTLEAVL